MELEQIVLEVVASCEVELWAWELRAGRPSCVVVFIDHEKGVTSDDCQRVTKQLRAVLKTAGAPFHDFLVEVSSPGMNRGLFKPEHYERYIGKTVKVTLYEVKERRRQWVGVLTKVEGQSIFLEVDGEVHVLQLSEIKKANLEQI